MILPAVIGLFMLSACTSRYFKPLPPPARTFQVEKLSDLPYRELWQGFVFNGEKVGFAHLKIEPAEGGHHYNIFSEAHLLIRFVGITKKIIIKSVDTVNPDLTLVSFHYEQNMGEKPLILDGRFADNVLSVTRRTGRDMNTVETKHSSPLYPAGVINLYPVYQGLKVGDGFRYPVYDPQSESIVEVSQSVISFEESTELDLEPSFKIETSMSGHHVSSWINLRGETIFELGIGGVLITHKESEEGAKKFLAEASLNKKDLIFDFSLIKTDKPITCPRKAVMLEASLEGVSGILPPLRGAYQDVRENLMDQKTTAVYRISKTAFTGKTSREFPPEAKDRHLYLLPSGHIESDHLEIKKTAKDIVNGANTSRNKVDRLVAWVSAEIQDEAVENFSALEVLRSRRGECKAHTMLYTALARASGIPTRMAGGIVYMEDMGFLYHAWAESYLDGWIPVDPTFNQIGVDATHIKLVEGQDWSSLLPLSKVIGRLKVRIIDFACSP